jgi:hypothetical protein
LKDAEYIQFAASGEMDPRKFELMRLGEPGRQEVEEWPKAGGVSAADVEALIRAFQEHADDPDVSESERRKARAVADYVRDLSVEAAGSILPAWLRSIGVGLPRRPSCPCIEAAED